MILWLRTLTTERAAKIIVFLLLFAMSSRAALDPDMWWHLRVGKHILQTGAPIYHDTFSHTFADALHKNHSAFAQIVMVGLWNLAGYLGLTLFVSILATSGMYFIYRAGTGTIYLRGFLLVSGAACAAVFWSPRPQMFTFLFSAILVFLLYRWKRNQPAYLWILPGLLWLWGNLHGGYIIASLFLAAFALGEWLNGILGMGDTIIPAKRIGKLLLLSLLSLVPLAFNPLGVDLFAVPFETLKISGLRDLIQEWQPPDFSQPSTWGFLITLALLMVAVLASRRFDFTECLLCGGTLFMALLSARNLPLFAIAALPVAMTHYAEILSRRGWIIQRRSIETPDRIALNLLLIILVALGTIAHIAHVSHPNTVHKLTAINFPLEAVDYLNNSGLNGNLFNSYNWGGYLLFWAADFPVFIDGRTDLYRDFLIEYNAAATGSPKWRKIFDKWEIDIALIETESGLARQLDFAGDWQVEYHDSLASIYVKTQEPMP